MADDVEESAAAISSACACGKKSNGKKANCIKGEGKSRCSCVIRGASCTRKCRCRTCQNKNTSKDQKETQKSTGCRCGFNKKGNFQSCTDIDGQRKTKCPSFASAQAVIQTFVFAKSAKILFLHSKLWKQKKPKVRRERGNVIRLIQESEEKSSCRPVTEKLHKVLGHS